MFEQLCLKTEELGRTTDDSAVHSRYPKQQMKMIWRLTMVALRGGTHMTKMKKSGVIVLVHIAG